MYVVGCGGWEREGVTWMAYLFLEMSSSTFASFFLTASGSLKASIAFSIQGLSGA